MTVRALRRRSRVALITALVLACAFFIGATAAVFTRQIEQKSLLTETIRASGWTAYQAQLEYIKTLAVVDLAIADQSKSYLEEIALRLEILLSRVPIITQSNEGDFLKGIPGVPDMVEAFEAELLLILDEVYSSSADQADSYLTQLRDWRERLHPFGVQLQMMLQQSVAYNEKLYQREGELREKAAFLPLALLVASGGVLVLMLILQVTRAERSLERMRVARLEAAESEASLRRIVQAAPVAFVVADPYTDCGVYINDSAADLLGSDLSSPPWRNAIKQCRRAVNSRSSQLESSRDIPSPVNLRNCSGALVSCSVVRSRIVWNGREHHLYSLVETTHSRNAEREAVQASALIAVGEMAASIVHEINQPLATMKMASSNAIALLQEGADLEKIAAKLARIDAQVDRARRITEQVRRLVRAQTDRPKSLFSAREAIELAATAVSEQFNRSNVALSLSLDISDGVLVAGDQVLFEQALINLLTNACHAFEKPALQAQDTGKAEVWVEATPSGEVLRVHVSDNAGGVAPEVLDNMFRAFVTTKSPGKGTGLGLSLTRKIIADMNGTIEGANVGEGARFTIEVQISERLANAAA